MIERIRARHQGRSKSTAYKDLVWTVATSADTDLDIRGQSRSALGAIETNLQELGSDKSSIVSAQVFIADMAEKPAMDGIWREWIGSNPENWPQRACLGVDLAGGDLIEVVVTAVRKTDSAQL